MQLLGLKFFLFKHTSVHFPIWSFTQVLVTVAVKYSIQLFLLVTFFKDMFEPEKNAVLSSGVGTDGAHPVLSLSGHAGHGLPCCLCFYSSEKVQTRCGVLFKSLWI